VDLWVLADWIGRASPLIALAIVGLGGIVLWRLWPIFAPRSDVAALHARLDAHEKRHEQVAARLDRGEARFNALETHIESLPTARDIQALRDTLADVRAELAGFRESNVWLREQVQLLVRHELNGGGNG